MKGKRWLVLTRWMNLDSQKTPAVKRAVRPSTSGVMKAYLLKERLERLWTYRYEGAIVRLFASWIDQLRWQQLPAFQRLARMLACDTTCACAFRNGLATALANSKVSPKIVQQVLRHTDIKTTFRYYVHSDTNAQRNALSQIEIFTNVPIGTETQG